jgi:hypothetical protein
LGRGDGAPGAADIQRHPGRVGDHPGDLGVAAQLPRGGRGHRPAELEGRRVDAAFGGLGQQGVQVHDHRQVRADRVLRGQVT